MLERIGIFGATGRLGSAVTAEAEAQGIQITLHANRAGTQANGTAPQVIIDASSLVDKSRIAASALEYDAAVIYTSPITRDVDRAFITEHSNRLAILIAENLSFGSFLQWRFASDIAPYLGRLQSEVVIIDRHPRTKSPQASATATRLKHALSIPEDACAVHAMRYGGPVSDHELIVVWGDEEIRFKHCVRSISVAARACLRLAKWLSLRGQPGIFHITDFYSQLMLENSSAPHVPRPHS